MESTTWTLQRVAALCGLLLSIDLVLHLIKHSDLQTCDAVLGPYTVPREQPSDLGSSGVFPWSLATLKSTHHSQELPSLATPQDWAWEAGVASSASKK